jgi:hypothetical protein
MMMKNNKGLFSKGRFGTLVVPTDKDFAKKELKRELPESEPEIGNWVAEEKELSSAQ